ncbi:MAG: hypothetical protein V3W41_05355 [Planctomycetota bacterium]
MKEKLSSLAEPSLFRGIWRGMRALAANTLREELRSRTFLVYVVLFLVFMGVYRVGFGNEQRIGVARFLDYAYSGMSALLLLAAAFTAISFKQPGRLGGATTEEVRRTLGAAAWFWGRLCGVVLALVALAFVLGAIVIIHYMARFGDAKGEIVQLRDRYLSTSFESASHPIFVRDVGDEVELDFAMPAGNLAGLEATFSPRLAVMKEGGGVRSSYPVGIRVFDPDRLDGGLDQSLVVHLHRGKSRRFSVDLEGVPRPDRLKVVVRKIHAEYLIRMQREDLELIGRERSFFANLLEAALMVALYASVLAALLQFIAGYLPWGVSLLAALGLLVLASSYSVVELGLLHEWSPFWRLATLEGAKAILPDFGDYDAATHLSRGRAVGGRLLASLVLRVLGTGFLAGLVNGFLDRRRARS